MKHFDKKLFFTALILLFSVVMAVNATEVPNCDYKTKIIRERLKDFNKAWNEFRKVSFTGIMIAIGWIITSKDARLYIGENSQVRKIILLSIIFLAIIIQLTFYDFYNVSQDLAKNLHSIDGRLSPEELRITSYCIQDRHLLFNGLFFIIIIGVLARLIYIQKPSDDLKNCKR
jgi:hypothetical protein